MDDCGGGYSESIAEICEELQNGLTPLLIVTPNGRDESGANRDCYLFSPAARAPVHTNMFRFLGASRPCPSLLSALSWEGYRGALLAVSLLECSCQDAPGTGRGLGTSGWCVWVSNVPRTAGQRAGAPGVGPPRTPPFRSVPSSPAVCPAQRSGDGPGVAESRCWKDAELDTQLLGTERH